MTWPELSKQFIELTNRFHGPSKRGSGDISVIYNSDTTVYVELGTYDIPQHPSYLPLGTFNNEEAAQLATQKIISIMTQIKE